MASSAKRCTRWVYGPANPDAVVPEGERPPYVVWAHGGPAAHADRLLDLEKAYFTSRGIGIIDVNYGGSTGYGRSYRERLRRQWGVLDVEDVIAAARALIDSGEADPSRLAIRGFAAGGWTALAAVTTHANERVFKAAVSYSGVTDPRGFAARTHDFESHYLDGLIGPLPGFEALYAERSPLGHVTGDTARSSSCRAKTTRWSSPPRPTTSPSSSRSATSISPCWSSKANPTASAGPKQ